MHASLLPRPLQLTSAHTRHIIWMNISLLALHVSVHAEALRNRVSGNRSIVVWNLGISSSLGCLALEMLLLLLLALLLHAVAILPVLCYFGSCNIFNHTLHDGKVLHGLIKSHGTSLAH
jgi:hypothetical protein